MWTRIGAPHESLVSISLDRGDVGKDFMVEIDTHTGNGVDLTWIVKLGTPSHPHESLMRAWCRTLFLAVHRLVMESIIYCSEPALSYPDEAYSSPML